MKSKTARRGSVELNLEIRLKDDNTDFVNELAQIEGVNSRLHGLIRKVRIIYVNA